MRTWFCDHAALPSGVARNVRITVDGNRIVEVAKRTRRHDDDVHLRGVTIPGAANGHSHAFHRALRGRTHGDGGNFWTWRNQMYAVTERLDPASYHTLARAVFAEMVLAGYTLVGEFHYLHHAPGGQRYPDPNAMGLALVEAAHEAGIRLTLLDACYLAGGLFASGHTPLDQVQSRFSDGSVESWAERVSALTPTPTARFGAAIHSVRAVPRDSLGKVAAVAHAGVGAIAGPMPLHLHLSEQPGENVACQTHYGLTPTELVATEGVLGPLTTVVHATHLTDHDLLLLGEGRVTACFCPTTERDLADGMGPARELVEHGVRLSLGSDQHAVIDPFEEVRGVEMHERLRSLERGRFEVNELLDMACAHGYESLGWPEGGRLAAGRLADFVTVRLDSPRTAGCGPDQIGYAATSADVTDVVVGGETVVRGGTHRLGDVGDLLGEALAEVRRT